LKLSILDESCYQILQVSRRQQARLESCLRSAGLLSQRFYGTTSARGVRPKTSPDEPKGGVKHEQHLQSEQKEPPETPAVNNKYLIVHPAYVILNSKSILFFSEALLNQEIKNKNLITDYFSAANI
jgi:hypothetical protein